MHDENNNQTIVYYREQRAVSHYRIITVHVLEVI